MRKHPHLTCLNFIKENSVNPANHRNESQGGEQKFEKINQFSPPYIKLQKMHLLSFLLRYEVFTVLIVNIMFV
jgi:hypothetical protein